MIIEVKNYCTVLCHSLILTMVLQYDICSYVSKNELFQIIFSDDHVIYIKLNILRKKLTI